MELGLDVGSGTVKAVVIDGTEIRKSQRDVEKRPVEKTRELLAEICTDGNYRVGISGINAPIISGIFGVKPVLDAVAVLNGLNHGYSDARTVFDIGQEKSSFYSFNMESGELVLRDFSTNNLCGAGGGALIEKMTRRLAFPTIDDFVEAAYCAEITAPISGRCAVFAESDVVHHSNKGRKVEEIAAGLCHMLARNFVNGICKGKPIEEPIYLIGGVARNKALVKFLESELGKSVIVPKDFLYIKARGCATSEELPEISLKEMLARLESYRSARFSELEPLKPVDCTGELPYEVIYRDNGNTVTLSLNKKYAFPDRKTRVFLGLDVGSVSTKAALIDEAGEFILGLYERTSGKPIDAVRDVIGRMGNLRFQGKKLDDLVEVIGSGTTGSGRGVARRIIGADIVRNEITAQAQGARFFYPDVDTVFEIGGQDSKYIYIQDGEVVDNEMNKVCAASTGSFLEEQATVLGISIERDFERYALEARHPRNLSDKCAVFMASSLLSHQDASIGDKCAGLTYSICLNYINRVARKGQIGKKIVFQGAVAFNRAVVSGFETLLGRRIYVPEFPHLTGAIGIASICREHYGGKNGK